MGMTVQELKDTPTFQEQSQNIQNMMERQFTSEAWESRKAQDSYIVGGEAGRAKIREDFAAEFPMGSSFHAQEETDENSFIENMGTQAWGGAKNTFDALRSADDAMAGIVDEDLAGRVARSGQRDSAMGTPLALKQSNLAMALETKRHSVAEGFFEKAAAWGMTAFNTGKEVVTNPEGVAYLVAQSAANMVPAMAGTIIGAAVAGPVGAASGAFTGSFATETGAYFVGAIKEEVYARGLEMTEENVQSVLSDKEFVDEASRKSKLKGAGTAGVDTLLAFGVGKLGAKTARTAEQAAVRTARESLKTGLRKGRVVGAEIASEPISEAAGQLAAEGKVDAGELMGETLGGIGAGAPGAAINVAAFGGQEAKYTAKRVKEIRAAKVVPMAKAPAQADYKAKVEAAVEKGEIGKAADPESKDYSPIQAVETAQKIAAKPETKPLDQVKLQRESDKVADTLMQRQEELFDKQEGLAEDSPEFIALDKEMDDIDNVLIDIEPLLKAIQSTPEITKEQVAVLHEKMKSAKHEDVTEGIMQMFGSKQTSNIDLSGIKDSPNLSPQTKTLIEKVEAFQVAEAALTTLTASGSVKPTSAVNTDVLEGGPGFKGISQYAQSIAVALSSGDKALAQEELNALTTFTKGHVSKAQVFQIAFNVANTGTRRVPVGFKSKLAQINLERRARGGKDYTEGFVTTTQAEALALTEAVSMLDSLINPAAIGEITNDQPQTEVSGKEDKESKTVEPVKEGSTGSLDPGTEVKGEPSGGKEKTSTGDTGSTDQKEDVVSAATSITTKSDVDVDNPIRNTFKAKDKLKGILHIAPDAVMSLEPETVGQFFSKDKPMDEEAVGVITAIQGFGKAFRPAYEKIATYKTGKRAKFRTEDPIQFLADEQGVARSIVMDAVMAASYKWLASRGKETVQSNEQAMQSILGLDKETKPNRYAQHLIGKIGVTAGMLQESLGQDIFSLLGIQSTPDSPVALQTELEISLGLQAIATMQSMGLLVQTDVRKGSRPGEEDTAVDGMAGLITSHSENFKGTKQTLLKNFIVPTKVNAKGVTVHESGSIEGQGFITFYRVKNDGTGMDAGITKYTDAYEASKHTWDRVFKGEDNKRMHTYFKPKKSKGLAKMKGTDFEISQDQQDNMDAHAQMPRVISKRTAGMYLMVDPENLSRIQGVKDKNDAHVDNHYTVDGVNAGILLSNQRTMAMIKDLGKQDLGYDNSFYVPEEPWRQGRMGEVGDINMQGDKNHRFLFGFKEGTTDVSFHDQDMVDQFMEAVALGLDIEAIKVGGMQEAISKAEDKLDEPVMVDAIAALRRILNKHDDLVELDPSVMVALQADYKEDMTLITDAVVEGEMGMHTFKALIEYARFQTAMAKGETSFNTDLVTEIDGVSNGPTIARFQVSGRMMDMAETLTALQNAGAAFHKAMPGLAKHLSRDLSHDAYQVTGFAWAGKLLTAEKDLIQKVRAGNNPQDVLELKQLQGMKNLFGKFRDEKGNVSNLVRSAAKDPTMTTIYGRGLPALIRGTAEAFLDDISSKIEKAVRKGKSPNAKVRALGKTELQQLNKNLHLVIGRYIFGAAVINPDNTINSPLALAAVLTDKEKQMITDHITNYHGKALGSAITDIYGDLKDSTKDLNTGVNLSTGLYNAALTTLVKKKQDEIGYTKVNKAITKVVDGITVRSSVVMLQPVRGLTLQELSDIETAIEGIKPYVKTYQGNKIPLAKADRTKNYTFTEGGLIQEKLSQVYASTGTAGGLAGKKAAAYEIFGLAAPRVRGAILTVHNQDSVVANTLMGTNPILNNHDGFTGAVGSARELAIQANEAFYKIMRDFDMGMEMYQAVESNIKSFNKVAPILKNTLGDAGFDSMMVAQLQAMGIYKFTIPNSPKPIKITVHNYRQARDVIMASMLETAKITKANKDKMLSAMTSIEQYSYPGGEYKIDQKLSAITHKGQTFGLSEVTRIAEARLDTARLESNDVEAEIQAIGDMLTAEVRTAQTPVEMGSKATMTLDENEYATAQKVNSMNVTQIYNRIKGDSTVKDSAEHDTYLTRLLNTLISGVLNPVDLYMKNNPDLEPEGKFIHTGSKRDKIFISSQNSIIGPISGALGQGIRMSTGEVYVHELIHAILHAGMAINDKVYGQVEEMFKLAEKHLDYKAFLTDPATTDKFEIEAAQERFDYVFRNTEGHTTTEFYEGTNVKQANRSNYLDEFMAIGLSNENFRAALSGITLSRLTRAQNSIAEFKAMSFTGALAAIFDIIMDVLANGFTVFTKKDVAAQLEGLAIQLTKKDSELKGKILGDVRKASSYSDTLTTKGNEFIKKQLKSTPVLGTVLKLKQSLAYVKTTDNPLGQLLRDTELQYRRLDQGIIKAVVTEMGGRTSRMEWIYELLSKRQLFLDAAKTSAIAEYVKAAGKLFKHKLTGSEKTAITMVGLKTDLSSLLDYMDISDVRELVQDKKKLVGKIASLKAEIAADKHLAPYATWYDRATDALGHFMIYSRTRKGEVVFQSARVIASLRNTGQDGKLSENQIDRAEAYVEQLASLQALKYTNNKQRAIFANLMEDSEGVNGVFMMHRTLKADSLTNAFNGNKMKFIKGYTKQILNPRVGYKIGTIDDAPSYAKEGYIMQPSAMKRDAADPTSGTDFFIFTSKNGKVNDLLTSVASFTSNKAKGTNSARIAEQMSQTTKTGIKNNDSIKSAKYINIFNMMNPNHTMDLSDGNFMVPAVNDKGDVSQYRYMMTETTKNDTMEQVRDFDEILGSMAGQIVDKVQSPKINSDLVTGLHAQYVAGYQANPNSFVTIGPGSTDPRLAEIFNMLTPGIRRDVQNTFGGNTLYVPKDMVDLAFGYHQYSVVEAFSKDPVERARFEKLLVHMASFFFKDEGKVVRALSSIEELAVWMTKTAKSNIIIKSLHVTLVNLGSNMMYLKSRGVPVGTILTLGWQAYKQGTKYNQDSAALAQARLELRMAQEDRKATLQKKHGIRARINKLENSINRNPTTLSIKSGLMPSLIDDVDTVTGGENFPHGIQKFISKQTTKLPEPVQWLGRQFFLTEDTTAFKQLNNAVKMTDFIGRHVLYNHYIKGGMKHELAIAAVEDEFVNFNAPTHRMIEYGNKIGLLWFTKYGTRILKVIKDSAVDRPLDVFLTYMVSVTSGMDNILNSVPGVTKDLFAPLGNPFDSFLSSLDESITSSRFFK